MRGGCMGKTELGADAARFFRRLYCPFTCMCVCVCRCSGRGALDTVFIQIEVKHYTSSAYQLSNSIDGHNVVKLYTVQFIMKLQLTVPNKMKKIFTVDVQKRGRHPQIPHIPHTPMYNGDLYSEQQTVYGDDITVTKQLRG